MKLTFKQKAAYGFGAVGKDMVYALSSSYILYYYQDILGISATFVGLVLMVARIFDAFNDPLMGVLVAKTKTRFGRFRPWLVTGTVINAFVLYAMFAAPSFSSQNSIMIYFAVVYILWGMTYTIMDIPYWSMIPAVTDTPKDRENLSVIGRTCAGIGAAIVAMSAMLFIGRFGSSKSAELQGFKYYALIIAAIFILAEVITCLFVKEHKVSDPETPTVKQMFKALLRNDQAIAVVVTIVLVNTALYITSNFVIYFFKYDVGGTSWKGSYTLFSTVCGAVQILAMMLLYPLLRKWFSTTKMFGISLVMAILGYAILLIMSVTGATSTIALLFIPGSLINAGNGMLTVLTTVYLTSTVDYGELKNGQRDESVIFSLQTFVVKASTAFAALFVGVGLDLIGLVGNAEEEATILVQSTGTLMGLRLLMTVLPTIGLTCALIFFYKKYKLTDEKVLDISESLKNKREGKVGA